MNPIDSNPAPRDPRREHDDSMSEALRLGLRGLQHDVLPAHDLFPGIAARLADGPAVATSQPPRLRAHSAYGPRRARWRAGMAVAAMLVLVFGMRWQLRPSPDLAPAGTQTALMVQEADRMTDAYRSAWHVLDAQRRPDVDASALHQIDASAAEVRAALERDPDARFLFERLQSLYSLRLDLAQRFAYPS